MTHRLDEYEYMWTTELHDYVIRRLEVKGQHVPIESIIHPASNTVCLIEDGNLEEAILEKMKQAGAKIIVLQVEDKNLE